MAVDVVKARSKSKRTEVQASEQGQAPKPKPEQNQDAPRPNRPPTRSTGQKRKTQSRTGQSACTKNRSKLKVKSVDVSEIVFKRAGSGFYSCLAEQPKRNNARRGPNRRRPRNPNYKKPETMAIQIARMKRPAKATTNRVRHARSYDNDFAERAERTERPEPQANVPSQANIGNQDSEARKPALR